MGAPRNGGEFTYPDFMDSVGHRQLRIDRELPVAPKVRVRRTLCFVQRGTVPRRVLTRYGRRCRTAGNGVDTHYQPREVPQ